MVLKTHEDKTHPGAIAASLTIPWGNDVDASKEDVGGYHLVWARDLYEVATAFLAIGDRPAAGRALDYLFDTQQKPDGSYPQNSWLDGRPYWPSLQMDEVSYPSILAWQLGKTDKNTFEKHIKPAADFVVAHGPATPQERWEEETGYSPSTIAAEIAGLICAADIARINGDEASRQRWTEVADDWAKKLPEWTKRKNQRKAALLPSITAVVPGTSAKLWMLDFSSSCAWGSSRLPIHWLLSLWPSLTRSSKWILPMALRGIATTTMATAKKLMARDMTAPA
jgi:GH15 family glucan-1,4-alpha-glucosidase